MSYKGSVSPTVSVEVVAPPVETALTIAVSPMPPVDPGQGLAFTGDLTRVDTGAGIGDQTIRLEQPPGTVIATTKTFANGHYLMPPVAAPPDEGVYTYRTSYLGTAGYKGSVSQALSVGVSVVPPGLLELIASILVAASPVIAVGAVVGVQELKKARVIP